MVKCINKGCYFCGVFVFYEVFGLKLEVLIKNFYESCDEILKMTQAIKKKLKILYWSIEINLILWIIVLGMEYDSIKSSSVGRYVVIAGFIFSAVLQHWAYYNVYKGFKEKEDMKN